MAVHRKSLREQVRDEILQRIASGQFRPGQRIGAAKLADELGVSYVPVREALHELVGAGVLEPESNKGIKVRVIGVEELISAFEVRAFVEALSAKRAASVLKGRACELEELGRATVDAADFGEAGEIQNRIGDFHTALIDAAGDEVLKRVWESVRSLVNSGMAVDYIEKSNLRHSAEEHEAIAVAINRGKGKKASDLVHQHYAAIIRHLRNLAATRDQERAS